MKKCWKSQSESATIQQLVFKAVAHCATQVPYLLRIVKIFLPVEGEIKEK